MARRVTTASIRSQIAEVKEEIREKAALPNGTWDSHLAPLLTDAERAELRDIRARLDAAVAEKAATLPPGVRQVVEALRAAMRDEATRSLVDREAALWGLACQRQHQGSGARARLDPLPPEPEPERDPARVPGEVPVPLRKPCANPFAAVGPNDYVPGCEPRVASARDWDALPFLRD